MEQPAAPSVTLSVIVPVYNVSDCIDRCLASVCGQRVEGMEILIVDDCSTDGSHALCRKWAERDPRIRLFSHPRNAGLSAARNTGLKHAQGDFVTFVDSDDALAPDTYAPNLLRFAEEGVDVVEFPVRIIRQGKRVETPVAAGTYNFDGWLRAGGFRHCYACNKLYRRKLWHGVRFEPGRSFEDILAIPAVLAQARLIACGSEGGYDYLYRPGSISTGRSRQALADLLHARMSLYAMAGSRFGGEDALTQYCYLLACHSQISLCAAGGEVRLPHRRLSLKALRGIGCGAKSLLKAWLNNCLGESFFRVLAWPEKLRRL